jgi:hypothetical protein
METCGNDEYATRWRSERGRPYDYEEGEEGEEGDSDIDVDMDIQEIEANPRRPQQGHGREREPPPTRSHTDPDASVARSHGSKPASIHSVETHERGDASSRGGATTSAPSDAHTINAASHTSTSAHNDSNSYHTSATNPAATKAADGNTDARPAASGAHAPSPPRQRLKYDASFDSAYGLGIDLKGPRRQEFVQKIKSECCYTFIHKLFVLSYHPTNS